MSETQRLEELVSESASLLWSEEQVSCCHICGVRSDVHVEVEVDVVATHAQLRITACLEHLDVMLARARAWIDATRGALSRRAV